MRKAIFYLGIISLVLTGCKSNEENTNVSNANTQTQQSQEIYIMGGKVSPGEEVNISSKISARVSKLGADIDQKVNKGDVLVYLDVKDIEAQIKQAQAAYSSAKIALEKAKGGVAEQQINQLETAVQVAKINLDDAQGNYDRTEQLMNANTNLQTAEANYNDAKVNYERTKSLFESGAVSKQTLDTTKTRLDVTQDQYNNVQISFNQNLDTAKTKLNNAKQQYDSAKISLDLTKSKINPENIATAQAQATQAQAALELVKTQLRNGTILSPISGVVSTRTVKEGEMISSNQTVMTIIDGQNSLIEAYCPERLVNQLKEGQKIIAKISELDNKKYEGTISLISPVIDARTKNVLVKVHLENSDSNLKPGMFTEIALKK